MNDKRMRRDSPSECESNSGEQSCFQRSLDSSFEYMDVDIELTNNNNSNGHRFIIPRSADQTINGNVASDESGIDLESPIRRRGLTQRDSCNGDSDDNRDEESSSNSDDEASGIDEVATSTSKATQKLKAKKILPKPLNIFKIDLEKVDEAIDESDRTKIGQNKYNKERIEFMIGFNKPKRKRRQAQQTQNTDSSESNLPPSYTLQPYNGPFESNNTFELMYFHKFTFSTDVESNYEKINLQKIRFLHRNDSETEEIFALSSGSSGNVVLKWADTNFPMSVASATLKGNSVTMKEVKNLFENRYISQFKMKKGELLNASSEFHLRFAPKVYTNFHAEINGNNGRLKQILGHSVKAIVKMQIRLESVGFPGGVSDMNGYSEICEKLSAIYRNQNLPRSRDFDSYLSKVSKQRKIELENLLLNELERYFRLTSTSDSKLKHVSITTKDSTKYCKSKKIEVYYRKKLVQVFDDYLQLEALHPLIRRYKDPHRRFAQRLDSFQISVAPREGEKRVCEKFFKCLEGILYDDSAEKDYWRVGGDWYEVSLKYSFEVYIAYNRILKASLIRKDVSPLSVKWPLKSDRKFPEKEGVHEKVYRESVKSYLAARLVREGFYCKLYENGFPSIIVTDAIIAPDNIEICDLFEFVSNPDGEEFTFYLHHIKKAIGADGYRVAIWQILLSAVSLLHALNYEEGNKKSSAYKLFEYVQKKGLGRIADYSEFAKKLRNATFVFSPIFASGDRDLDHDPLIKYDFSDFEELIQPEDLRKSMRKDLKPYLLKNEFIHQDGEFTAKWFEACSVKRDGGFAFEKVERGVAFDPFPGKKYVRDILKKTYFKHVDALSVKHLIVHMSECLRNMGFGLKICQIEGEEDELLPPL